MPFRVGPDVQPFSAAAWEGIKLFEDVTPAEIASAVPRIVITKIDPRTGRAVNDVRPLMYDLVESPQFGANDFGVDTGRFLERSTVSLRSLTVKSELQYGVDALRKITLNFTVHRPEIVFDRSTGVAWREILEEGNSFSLRYGWVADPTVCRNPLLNGIGHVTDSGTVLRSSAVVLLVVARYTTKLSPSGEVEVMVEAYENGDIALREVRFSDVAGVVIGRAGEAVSDSDAARALFDRLRNISTITMAGRGRYFRLLDVLDGIVAPMLEEATRMFGYRGNPSVRLSASNFNRNAGQQSKAWGGRALAGQSIGEFLVPVDRLVDEMSRHLSSGRAMLLRNFLNYLFGFMNSDEAWARVSGNVLRPLIGVSYVTTESTEGLTLNMMILDRNAVSDNVKGLTRLPLDRQTRSEVMRSLDTAGVPVIELGRAGSMVLDASFEMQPTPLLQSIQVETAEYLRKDRVERTHMPDVESRKGQAFPHDIVPVSILEGSVVLVGNFIFGPFDRLWFEFFGSSSISGIFNVISKEDTIEPGKFTSTLQLISEGIDPLNTRFRFTPEELASRRST
jgi:hypothetical protein